jgi:hypothetical protein
VRRFNCASILSDSWQSSAQTRGNRVTGLLLHRTRVGQDHVGSSKIYPHAGILWWPRAICGTYSVVPYGVGADSIHELKAMYFSRSRTVLCRWARKEGQFIYIIDTFYFCPGQHSFSLRLVVVVFVVFIKNSGCQRKMSYVVHFTPLHGCRITEAHYGSRSRNTTTSIMIAKSNLI